MATIRSTQQNRLCRDRRLRYRGGVRWFLARPVAAAMGRCGEPGDPRRRPLRERSLRSVSGGSLAIRTPRSGTCRTPTASGPRKIVMRFSETQIRAAVEQGAYEDPRAIDYLTRTLLERQLATGRAWFSRVSPLDQFAIDDAARLSFATSRSSTSAIRPVTRYVARSVRLRRPRARVARRCRRRSPRELAGAARLPRPHDGYTIVRAERGARRPCTCTTVRIHMRTRSAGAYAARVGIRRS